MTLNAVLLLAATLAMGLVDGAYVLYAHAIMPGLRTTGDHTFVAAFQAVDRAIINPWFLLTSFVGAPVLTAAALVTHRGGDALPWIGVALALCLIATVITFAVNVPLNNALKAAGDPDRIGDLAGVRERFGETRWAAWNLVRVVTSTGAFACLAWALVLYGRSTP